LKSDKEAFAQLDQEKRKTYPILFKWLKVNFSEAYSAWIHIKVNIFIQSFGGSKNKFSIFFNYVPSVLGEYF